VPVADQPELHWRFDPRSCYLITLVAGELSQIDDSWDGIDVVYYVQNGAGRRGAPDGRLRARYFSRLYRVRYPYPRTRRCLSDFIFGGMENDRHRADGYDAARLRAAIDTDFESLVAPSWPPVVRRSADLPRPGRGLALRRVRPAPVSWREHIEGRDAPAPGSTTWESCTHEDSGRYRRTVATKSDRRSTLRSPPVRGQRIIHVAGCWASRSGARSGTI
jgi:hypothetical protein